MGKIREIVEVPGMVHKAPSPLGVKIGNMVFSGGIFGCDTETQVIPKNDPEKQAQLMFENIRRFMEKSGGTTDNIAHVTLYIQEEGYREIVNKYWVDMFPDEHDRPARHAVTTQLRGDMLMQVEIIGVLTD